MVFLAFFAASESDHLDAPAPAVRPLLLLLCLLSDQDSPQPSLCPNIPK
jgi:hypothetical protein